MKTKTNINSYRRELKKLNDKLRNTYDIEEIEEIKLEINELLDIIKSLIN